MVGLLLAVVAVSGCGREQEQPLPAGQLRIATGSSGGVYTAYGKGLEAAIDRHLPRLRASVLHSGGSVSNLRRLEARRAEVAFSQADSATEASKGTGRFSKPIRIAALAHLYDDYVQVVVRRGSGMRRIDDLATRRVSTGAEDSGVSLIAERVLAVSSLRGSRAPRRVQLDLVRSARALADGGIDAFFWSGGLPTPEIVDLQRRVPIGLIDLRGTAAALSRRYGDLYTETQIPRRIYGARRAVSTVSVANSLVVRRDLDKETAYRLTRLLFERHEELKLAHPEAAHLNRRAALATFPLPLHPGAARFFREDQP